MTGFNLRRKKFNDADMAMSIKWKKSVSATQRIKLVVVGDSQVGKTCLLITLTTNSYPHMYIPTFFDNYVYDIAVAGKSYEIYLHDTLSQEDYTRTRLRLLNYPGTEVFLLLYSIEDPKSLQNIQRKWIPELRYHMPETPILLVATKIDLRGSMKHSLIGYCEGWKMAQRFGLPYEETSSIDGSVRNCFETAVSIVLEDRAKHMTRSFLGFVGIKRPTEVFPEHRLKDLKLVVVGDGAVGKSSLLITYTTGRFPLNYVPTVFGYDYYETIIACKLFCLELIDTAGQKDYDRLRPMSYPGTDIFLLCFSVDNPSSFENVEQKWIPEIRHHIPDAPILLVATKKDRRATSDCSFIPYDEGCELARRLGLPYVETSSRHNDNVKECIAKAVNLAVEGKAKRRKANRRSKDFELTPKMPSADKAPWIDIQISTLHADLGKALEQPAYSDVTFVVDGKSLSAHKVVLCSASAFFCRVFGLKPPDQDVASSPRVWNFTWEDINEGKIAGLAGIHDGASQDSSLLQTAKTQVNVSADVSYKTFRHVLEFLYTGLSNITEDASLEDLVALRKASSTFRLPELDDIVKNLQNEEEFLNPSIGTYLNDQLGQKAKWLFLNRPALSDIRFTVEGATVYGHKIMLTSRCEFMAGMFSGVFTESSKDEIRIEDTSLECFLAILEYIYTDHAPIEEGDAVGILVAADQYGQERLKNLCELYITKGVDVAVATCIAEAHVDVIGLLTTAQMYNANQLATWCLHFISSNFIAFQQRSEFKTLEGENQKYIQEHRWPPVSYLEALEKYKDKHGQKEDKCKIQ